jgi:hypothetical protein
VSLFAWYRRYPKLLITRNCIDHSVYIASGHIWHLCYVSGAEAIDGIVICDKHVLNRQRVYYGLCFFRHPHSVLVAVMELDERPFVLSKLRSKG